MYLQAFVFRRLNATSGQVNMINLTAILSPDRLGVRAVDFGYTAVANYVAEV